MHQYKTLCNEQQVSVAHEVSVAVTYRTRDHKVSSLMLTCS